jgi:hypothetical protein
MSSSTYPRSPLYVLSEREAPKWPNGIGASPDVDVRTRPQIDGDPRGPGEVGREVADVVPAGDRARAQSGPAARCAPKSSGSAPAASRRQSPARRCRGAPGCARRSGSSGTRRCPLPSPVGADSLATIHAGAARRRRGVAGSSHRVSEFPDEARDPRLASFMQRRARSASRTKLHQEAGRESEKSLGEADESATGSTFCCW